MTPPTSLWHLLLHSCVSPHMQRETRCQCNYVSLLVYILNIYKYIPYTKTIHIKVHNSIGENVQLTADVDSLIHALQIAFFPLMAITLCNQYFLCINLSISALI